jgi:hypothetical protein
MILLCFYRLAKHGVSFVVLQDAAVPVSRLQRI